MRVGGGSDAAAFTRAAATSPEGLYRLPPAVATLGFVVALFLEQVELRDSARAGSTDMGEGSASPSGADSQRALEASVGKIIDSTDLDTACRIMTVSDTRLDVAGAWAVTQVELHARTVGHASLGMIAARRLPPDVLLPVFGRMVEEGCPTRDGTVLSHTRTGGRAAQVIGTAWGNWLADRVQQGIGRPSGTDLRAAVNTIAKRLLVEDLNNGLPRRARELAGSSTA
ncbi:hypothetical protein QFZ32_001482 [Streptomyces canus]|nr:hypothetical protein [Streptomyces canus]